MISFPLLGVPVRIHLSFLLVAFFGLGAFDGWGLVAWTGAVFLAVLLHESGHAFLARALGATGLGITLFALGGYTTWRPGARPMGPGRRFLVSAAGSAVGIAVGGAVLLWGRSGGFVGWSGPWLDFVNSFVWASLGWGVLNWVPILPLDGGQMLRAAVEMVAPAAADLVTAVVSVVVGAVLFVAALRYGQTFLAFFLVIIVVTGLRGVALRRRPSRPAPEAKPPPEFPI